ncbi:MAG: hypothetical protein ACJ76F_14405 [Bacteroidia bacterium]
MRDVFWTILAVWLVYKVYNALKGNTYVFQKHEHYHNANKEEGKVTIEPSASKKSNAKDEEYTDYEEIK